MCSLGYYVNVLSYFRKPELQTIFTTLLHAHFLLPDLTLTSTTVGRSLDDDKVNLYISIIILMASCMVHLIFVHEIL